ncbi:MAG: antibiotic biosynthesis monooxygenase [Cyanobacteriota bacterium]|nr:antibiotic biosynthesis monooxygenase [Cyanobacteriota bacterium]
MTQPTSASQELVTTVVSHHVCPGREAGYEEWLKGISAVARTFEGYMGVSIFRPQPGDILSYVLVVQFDTCDRLLKWLNSDTRHEWLERVQPLLLEPESLQTHTGLETWFEVPIRFKKVLSPKRYKQAILVWLGVMGASLFFQPILAPLLAPLHPIVAMGCSVTVTVACLTYFLMPQLTRIFRGWLYPSDSKSS